MALAKSRTLLVMGDFNAPHPMWGYKIASKRGKALVQAMGKHELYLINEPGIPTRTGNSVTNDTTPDLTWSSGPLETRWNCDDADLGSDHKITKIDVLGPQYKAVYGKARIMDWDKMRKHTRHHGSVARTRHQTSNQIEPRAILALHLKGALDNVTHASILRNLNGTGCGARTFHYVRNFLEDRAAVLTIGNAKTDPITLGERATPQGSVISPLLFNLALLPLPKLLERIEGLDHAFYADDITVWTNRAGSEGWMEETLQRAATTVHEYAKSCGLSCAPQKSELLVVQPGVGKRSRCGLKIEIDGIQVEPTQQCRILGLLLRSDGKADAAVDKICLTSEQVLGMPRRVAKKNRGIKENDELRLAQAFVVTRTTYSAPYLNLTGTHKAKLDVILRKATKQALGLPAYTSTKRLYEMGVHNTVDELVEAHLSNQMMRLSGSEHGRRILEKIGWRPEPVQTSGRVPEHWRDKINTKPLPRNMSPGEDGDRRKARAKALETRLEGNPNVMYVDAALVKGSDKAALAVTTRDRLVAVASTRTRNATNAEEMAIALALIQPGATHVVTDSKKAYVNYRGGLISSEAARVLKRHKTPDNEVELIWTPAHSSLVGNNIADYYARDMSRREIEETGGPDDNTRNTGRVSGPPNTTT
ncbi:uncharacterized protein LOC144157728 [Haemaphysalis longicornis]